MVQVPVSAAGTDRPYREVPVLEPRVVHHHGTLYARVLGDGARPLLLLHGLIGSDRYWGEAYDELARHRALIVPDLLGFGRSPKPDSGYDLDDQAVAIEQLIDELGLAPPVTVVGHSVGALVGLRLAYRQPTAVRGVIAFGPPLFATADQARQRLAAMGPMARLFALPGSLAERACRWVCDHRSMAASIAVLTHPSLPAPVARDSVQHTWASYRETMERIVLASHDEWVQQVSCPVALVVGDKDRVVDHPHARSLAAAGGWTIESWPGDHHLPLRQPARCVAFVDRQLSEWSEPEV